jgi:hypothetical protein
MICMNSRLVKFISAPTYLFVIKKPQLKKVAVLDVIIC